jgi:hypothetical protein
MAVYESIQELKNAITDTIYANDSGLITAEIMQERLHDIIDTLNSISTSVAGVKAYLESANDLAQIMAGNDKVATEAWAAGQYESKNSNIQSHIGSTSNPHQVTVGQIGAEPANSNIQSHISSTSNPHQVSKSQVGLGNVTNDAQIPLSQKGAASGVAELDVSGKVPSAQLPSYVDDVLEAYIVGPTPFASNWLSLTVGGPDLTPEPSKIYIVLTAGDYQNRTYRWSGSVYVEISQSIAIGETSSTAYRGDRGKTAYDHSQTTHDKNLVGLGNVDNTSDLNKPVSNATQTALNGKLGVNDTAAAAAKLITTNFSIDEIGGELCAVHNSTGKVFKITIDGDVKAKRYMGSRETM